MGLLQRHRWFAAAAGITLAFAAVSAFVHPSYSLTVIADLTGLVLILAAAAITLTNALDPPRSGAQLLGPDVSRLLALGLQ